jgi:hypothetical protein
MSKLTRFRVERLVQSTPGFESGRRVGEREREFVCSCVCVCVYVCTSNDVHTNARAHSHVGACGRSPFACSFVIFLSLPPSLPLSLRARARSHARSHYVDLSLACFFRFD